MRTRFPKLLIEPIKAIASLEVRRIGFIIFLATASMALSACSDSDTSKLTMSTSGGLEIEPPEFLLGRAINVDNLDAIVTVENRSTGEIYDVERTSAGSFPWQGQVYVPENLDPFITVFWIETQVPGLPADRFGVLPLATYVVDLAPVTTNWAIEIQPHQYITHPDQDARFPELDLDNDGYSNLDERTAGSRPGDESDVVPTASIPYTPQAPVIDGIQDAVWDNAQTHDRNLNLLQIDTRLSRMRDDQFASESDDYKWAGMHDGEYLYLLVFAERGANQTPVADRFVSGSGTENFEPDTNDSIEIFLDGNHSRSGIDSFDDYKIAIALMLPDGTANSSGILDREEERIESNLPLTTDGERPVTAAIEYATCICTGTQQLYEVKLELAGLNIPLEGSFGFDVQINNDWDGRFTDTNWGWSANYDDLTGTSFLITRTQNLEKLRLEPIAGVASVEPDESLP